MIPTLEVDLGERSYPIYIGHGLLAQAEAWQSWLNVDQLVILSNDVVAPLYLEQVRAHAAGRSCHALILADGEATKTLDSFARVMSFMLERRIERGALLVALGGGVIGDLGGFAAACYQRGIAYLQVPTTLLAQVDSAVGGKTAVNHALGKNMIGAFHQPRAVIADTATLDTLPDRELRAGLSEVIKYGLIRDYAFFAWLEANLERLLQREPDALAYAIKRSCENKAEVVAGDEREAGERALLNLGHTFGHAIETAVGYGTWLHGEAVAAGMCMAVRMSARAGWLTATDVERVEALLARADLPIAPPPAIAGARLRELMEHDKKNTGGRIRLVLLEALGRACITRDYDDGQLSDILASAGAGDGR